MDHDADRAAVIEALTRAGCVAAEEEADELIAAARQTAGTCLAWWTAG